MCILAVRAVIVQIAFYLHVQVIIFPRVRFCLLIGFCVWNLILLLAHEKLQEHLVNFFIYSHSFLCILDIGLNLFV